MLSCEEQRVTRSHCNRTASARVIHGSSDLHPQPPWGPADGATEAATTTLTAADCMPGPGVLCGTLVKNIDCWLLFLSRVFEMPIWAGGKGHKCFPYVVKLLGLPPPTWDAGNWEEHPS